MEDVVEKSHELEDGWVIHHSTHSGKTWWMLLHHHNNGRWWSVHSYMKLGSYKCNECGALAPTQVNGFYELCKWSTQ